jgi:hypothetical protein
VKARLPKNLSPGERHSRVLRELDSVLKGDVSPDNLIEEQLRQCPEAFEVGKIVEKLCESLKHEPHAACRLLPPPGAVMPPVV